MHKNSEILLNAMWVFHHRSGGGGGREEEVELISTTMA